MNGRMLWNLYDDIVQNPNKVQTGALDTTKAPTKYCGTCKAHRTYLNDGDFDICNKCEQPILGEAEQDAVDKMHDETRLQGSEGKVW